MDMEPKASLTDAVEVGAGCEAAAIPNGAAA